MKRLLFIMLGILCSTIVWCAKGEKFTTSTIEGIEMTFLVTDEDNKSCQVGTGYVNEPAINSTYSGAITIPSVANGYNVTSITKSAFSECKLSSITIPGSVVTIDNYAFENCYELISVTISEGVETIGRNAFCSCLKLSSLYIPSSIKTIATHAFSNCRSISSIVVSENNTVFDSHNNCNAIIETSSKDLVLGCKNTVIPRDVRSIGDNAFYGCYNLNKIVIPDNVYRIGADAFDHCSNLKTINIPDNISFIGNYAFYGCSSLTSITLPPNVNYGKYSFNNTGLTKVVVGTSQPKSLNGEEFNKTSQMTLYVPQGSKSKYESATYWRNFKEIIELTNNTYVPYGDMTIKIVDGLEQKCEVYSAVSQPSYTIVPSSVSGYKVIGIDEEAFEEEDGIESIAIPSSIEYIGTRAFRQCKIKKVVISDIETWCKISFDGELSNPLNDAYLYIANWWSDKENLVKDLYIPNNVSAINDYAFYGSLGITSVSIPKEVNLIGNCAFWNCKDLESVTIDSPTPPQISNNSFSNKNATLYVPYGSIETYIAAGFSNYFKEIKSMQLNVGDTFVEKTKEGVDIKLFVISNEDKTCGVGKDYYSFNDKSTEKYCINPDYDGEVTIPELANGYKVISIAEQAFSSTNGMKVKSIFIPDCITTIGRKAFENCKALSEIELPNSINNIGDYAFAGCENLKSVILPNGITLIPSFVFQNCNQLNSIVIPNSVVSIAQGAFENCSSLHSFSIPESVLVVALNAFVGTAWYNDLPNGLVYKDNILLGYKGGAVSGHIEIKQGTRLVGAIAFENCTSISSLELPNSLKVISSEAFMNCSGITAVTIPKSVESIFSQAFAGCDNVSTIINERPDPITIYSNIFSNQNATLYVPEGSKSLYESAEGWKDFENIVERKVEATESNKLYCDRLEINKGKTADAIIKISDDNLISAIEFDLVLPSGITLAKNEDGEFIFSKGNLLKNNSWRVIISEMENNSFHIKCYTTVEGNIIFSHQGDLLSLRIKTTEDMQEGVFNATINNIYFNVSYEKLLKAQDSTFIVELTNYVKGDVNGDDVFDVTDVVSMINFIMGNPSDSFKIRAADMNNDGEVDIFDVMKLINFVMEQEIATRSNTRAAEGFEDQAIIKNTDEGLMLGVNDPDRFTAFQFDVEVADDIELLDARLTSNTGGHKLYFLKNGQNVYRVIGLSMNNSTLTTNGADLVELKFSKSGNVQIDNITFVTPQETKVRFAGSNTTVTGIGSITIDQQEKIFDLSGRKIDNNRSQLPKGVYIINNKKVVIK